MTPLGLVVAINRRGVIGHQGRLPWHFPEDLRYFQRVTRGHTVIMGRGTFESVGKPLKDRRNIVVTRDRTWKHAGCETTQTVEEAIALGHRSDLMPMIIGGSHIYGEAWPSVTHVFLTEIPSDAEGDVHFPDVEWEDFREVSREPGETPGLVFVRFERISPDSQFAA